MNTQIIVELTQEDVNSLVALMDAAVKATGIQGAVAAADLMRKLQGAVNAASAAKPADSQASAP